jgi:hypothetical protein
VLPKWDGAQVASVLAKENPALFRQLPESFKVGHPLPAHSLTRKPFPSSGSATLSRPTGEGLRRGRIIVRVSSTAANCWQLGRPLSHAGCQAAAKNMCARYSAAKDLAEFAKFFNFVCRIAFFAPRYNINRRFRGLP